MLAVALGLAAEEHAEGMQVAQPQARLLTRFAQRGAHPVLAGLERPPGEGEVAAPQPDEDHPLARERDQEHVRDQLVELLDVGDEAPLYGPPRPHPARGEDGVLASVRHRSWPAAWRRPGRRTHHPAAAGSAAPPAGS